MQDLLERIIYELLNCNKLGYKYVGMQLASEFTKKRVNFDKRDQKVDDIKDRLFKILLENIDRQAAITLQNNITLIKCLAEKIKKNSGWRMNQNGTFSYKDKKYSYTVSRNKDGYFVHPRKNGELGKVEADFYNRYASELYIIHSSLSENEKIYENIVCFNNGAVSDSLLTYIIEYINNKEQIKDVRRIYEKK